MGQKCCTKNKNQEMSKSELVLNYRNDPDTVVSIEYHFKIKTGFHKQMKMY